VQVIIVDSHSVSRLAIEELISEEFGEVEVFPISSFEQITSILSDHDIQLIITELYYPNANLVESYKFLQTINIPFVIYTLFDVQTFVKAKLKAIVNEQLIVSKTQPTEDLLKAIRSAVSFNTSKSIKLEGSTRSKLNMNEVFLSGREKEMVIEMLKGKSLMSIAAENDITYTSMISMRRRIFKKYKVKNLTDLFHILQFFEA